MENWLQQIMHLLPEGTGYYLLLFLIAFGESLPMVGLLVPGSTLIVLAGFLVFHGKGLYLPLVVVTSCGALSGDLLSFWLGGHYGRRMLTLRSFRKHRRLVLLSQQFFCAHGGKSLFFARFLGPIRGITPFIAGLSKMARRPVFLYSLISAILWGITYPGLGYLGGISWQRAQSLSTRFGLLVLAALVITLIHYWLRRSLNLNRKNPPPEE